MIKSRRLVFTGLVILNLNLLFFTPSVLASTIKIEKVLINEIELVGNTVLTKRDLEFINKLFKGKYLSTEELISIRKVITDIYIKKGYKTSGAIIPEQDLTDGKVKVTVIEGKLTTIEVVGLNSLNENYIFNKFNRFLNIPLNIFDLEDALKLLQINPLFSSVESSLDSTGLPGESVLTITVKEAPPLSINLSVNNFQSSSVGSTLGQIEITELNLLGWGDKLILNGNFSQGSQEFQGSYTVPLSGDKVNLTLGYQRQNTEILEKPFNDLDINTFYDEYSFILTNSLINTFNNQFSLSLELYFQQTQTYLFDDIPFSFVPEAVKGQTRVRNLVFGQQWYHQNTQRIILIRSAFTFGLDIFDATSKDYWLWLGQFQWAEKITDNIIIVNMLGIQLSPFSLLGSQKFSIGGAYTVRGYQRDILIGDNGMFNSFEVRTTLVGTSKGNLVLTPFFDVGTVWNNGRIQGNINSLASLGLSLGWFSDNFEIQFSYALPLVKLDRDQATQNFNFSVEWIPIRF